MPTPELATQDVAQGVETGMLAPDLATHDVAQEVALSVVAWTAPVYSSF